MDIASLLPSVVLVQLTLRTSLPLSLPPAVRIPGSLLPMAMRLCAEEPLTVFRSAPSILVQVDHSSHVQLVSVLQRPTSVVRKENERGQKKEKEKNGISEIWKYK